MWEYPYVESTCGPFFPCDGMITILFETNKKEDMTRIKQTSTTGIRSGKSRPRKRRYGPGTVALRESDHEVPEGDGVTHQEGSFSMTCSGSLSTSVSGPRKGSR